ncbi:MAG: BatD family protein [Marinilabiliaceae bacterium]
MRTRFIYILALTLLPLSLFGQEVEFKASAPNSVVQGERFQLVYSINEKGENIRVPDMNEFEILMGPTTSQRSQVRIINGDVSREQEYSYTYILKANQTGTFTVPAATIEVDGEKHESNSLSIEVIEEEEGSTDQQTEEQATGTIGDDDLFVKMTPNKSNVYRGQPVLLTTKIFTRVNLEGISDIQHPAFREFIAEDIEEEQNIEWSLENVDGKTYRVGTYNKKVLYPQESGNINIEPISFEFLVRMRQKRQSNNVFDNFFDTHRTIKKTVTSDDVSLNVNSLPSSPGNFSGFVGTLDMDVDVSKRQVKRGDGITVTTRFTGTGNMKVTDAPDIEIPADFDEFDPKSSSDLKITTNGHQGTRTFEQLIIPRHAGTFEIPAIEYVYFDPERVSYQTLKSDPITIEVERSEGSGTDDTTSAQGSTSGRNRERVQVLGRDIRYIHTSPPSLKPANTFLFGTWKFALGYIIPLIVFIILSVIYRQKIKENANTQLKKTKQANKVARKKLKKAAKHLKSGNKEAFYLELSKGLWGYISDKLIIPVAELTSDKIRQKLADNGAQEENINRLLDIMETCEFARYAPSGNESEREDLYKTAVDVISKLENNLKNIRKTK